MKDRYKKYLKIYMIPAVFIATSFIFTTFAWFAYSGLKNVSTEIDVKAWHIELTKSNEVVTNNIVISLNDVYPGMETINELVNIENKGDSDAKLSYKILSSRILDTEVNGESLQNNRMLTDDLSHEYPFHVNIDLSKKYIAAGGDSSTFEVSVSWPLDSGDDNLDSLWGTNSYNFQNSEKARMANDPTYTPRPAIQIIISIIAEQYTSAQDDSDMQYNMGDIVLYDVVLNRKCDAASATCLSTTIIDYDNKLSDNNVTLLPVLFGNYQNSTFANYSSVLNTYTSNWSVPNRALTINDLLSVISHDVMDTLLNGNNISPQIVGVLDYNNRINTEIARVKRFNGYYTFKNNKFSYLVGSNSCYWTNSEYDQNSGFALEKIDETDSKIYGKLKTDECRVVPVLIVPKDNL